MALLSGSGLTMSFGPFDIFDNVNITIHKGERAAIVGANGQGKTTLLRLLIGEEKPTRGEIHLAKGTKIGFLRQEVSRFSGEKTLYQLADDAFADVRDMGEMLSQMEKALATDESLLEKYGQLQSAFDIAGGYHYTQTIDVVLTGLGFSKTQYHQPLSIFSGGEQTRAHLARLLLERPDLLLLDEPTNHLDLAAIEWLEKYLATWRGAVLIVSHDRYFLDKVVNRIFELSFSSLERYRGNYSAYLRQRAERSLRREKEFKSQQKFIAKEEEFIRRNLAGQRTKEAQGRRKRLERLKRDKFIERQRSHKAMNLALHTEVRSGDLVLATHNLQIGYPDGDILVTLPDFEIRRGDCVALLGENGSGKTTFLKTILKQLSPKRGKIRRGAAVEMAYFPQIHTDLNPQNTVLDELHRRNDNMTTVEARNHLGKFLFSGDDVFKLVGDLSGGERSRLALAKFALSGANFLILDEPTNHLDIPAQEILESMLKQFNGTILLVSHDRYFVNALASHILSIEKTTGKIIKGSYDDYLAQKNQQGSSFSKSNSKPGTGKSLHLASKAEKRAQEKRRRHLQQLESEIEATEEEISELENAMEKASFAQNIAELQKLGLEYQKAEEKLTKLLNDWVILESEATT